MRRVTTRAIDLPCQTDPPKPTRSATGVVRCFPFVRAPPISQAVGGGSAIDAAISPMRRNWSEDESHSRAPKATEGSDRDDDDPLE